MKEEKINCHVEVRELLSPLVGSLAGRAKGGADRTHLPTLCLPETPEMEALDFDRQNVFSDYLPALSNPTDRSGLAKFHGSCIFKLSPDAPLDHCSSIIATELCHFASSEHRSSLFMLTIKPGNPYLTYIAALHSYHY